ncbi:hypothetical protein Aduo_006942 [Ancylostoma duodenale]
MVLPHSGISQQYRKPHLWSFHWEMAYLRDEVAQLCQARQIESESREKSSDIKDFTCFLIVAEKRIFCNDASANVAAVETAFLRDVAMTFLTELTYNAMESYNMTLTREFVIWGG